MVVKISKITIKSNYDFTQQLYNLPIRQSTYNFIEIGVKYSHFICKCAKNGLFRVEILPIVCYT